MLNQRLLIVALCAALLAACGAESGRTAAPTSAAATPETVDPGGAAAASPAAPTDLPATSAPAEEPTAAAPDAGATAAPPAQADATIDLQLVTGDLRQPIFVTHAGDGSGRLFVVEKGGTIAIVRDGKRAEKPFLDISALVNARGSEQGLLGLAFHPGYKSSGRFFVYYTATNGDNTVARYQVSGDPDSADPASGVVLFAVPDPAPNHNGGMLAFGPDGYLYAGLGDGGSAGDPWGNGQNRGALLGKLLRLDVDKGDPYAIPPDNPWASGGDARGEVWAYGLRNPWRFSFDRATGDLYIGDVGQNQYEEIDFQPAGSKGGQNYGWNIREATHCYQAQSCQAEGLVDPIHEYSHAEGCSVTGGYVYRGAAMPELQGIYLFGDYCSGTIWSLHQTAGQWEPRELLQSKLSISSFGEDEAGELYVTDLGGGLYRMVASQ
ncbi:MAG: PQQ-dependent sugar dehydrogenase [Kouleothrix sp.]|nr:PQQ-dependent sugar dehydrogenase [Kouleothrix sp.]